jgi:hypothetical protein
VTQNSRHDPSGDDLLGRLFAPTAGPVRPVPFPRAKQLKRQVLYNYAWAREAIAAQSNGDVELVDPSTLSATQYGITKPGVAYYLTRQYARTGATYADQDKLANRFPLIYIKDGGESLIIAGHHRSTAALLRNEPLLAIVVREPWAGSRPSARLVTPTMVLGIPNEDDEVGAHTVTDLANARLLIDEGQRVAVPDANLARRSWPSRTEDGPADQPTAASAKPPFRVAGSVET